MSRTTQEGVFILLKVVKRHEEKRPEGRTELTKLKTRKTFQHVKCTRNSTCKKFQHFKTFNL